MSVVQGKESDVVSMGHRILRTVGQVPTVKTVGLSLAPGRDQE